MRTGRLKKILGGKGHFPYLITDLYNIKYLTGFSGSNATIVADDKKFYFITDSRYEEYVKAILPKNYKFILQSGSTSDAVRMCMSETGKNRLFLESRALNLVQFLDFKKSLKGIRLIPVEDDPVAGLRMVKDRDEIDTLREAAAITDRCFYHLLELIRPGLTEWEVAVEIETYYKRNGCTACSFDPIVASGAGSSMPHYMPSMTKKISKGDILLVDMGCVYKGYNSDLTRTVFTGKIDSRLEKIYHIVREANERALEAVKPGMGSRELDAVARSYISGCGYGENFGHGLGHGVGIEIHEMPAVKKAGNVKLKKNMVFTIEPGIYIPGLGGVRIEDMVLVNTAGGEALTQCSKDIIVI